jgi:hypothetical protein
LNTMNAATMEFVGTQSLLMALKESYGYLILVGIVMLIIIMLSNYRTTITRFLPRLITVSSWMTGRRKEDPAIN